MPHLEHVVLRQVVLLQCLEDTLEYASAVLNESSTRFRGGVAAGIQLLHDAALKDGVPWSSITASEVLMTELESLIASMQSSAVDTPPRENTVRWYQERQHEPVAEGSDITVLQACYWTLFTRHYRGLSARGMDDLCSVLAVGGFLKGDNIMPRCALLQCVMSYLLLVQFFAGCYLYQGGCSFHYGCHL